MNTRENIRSTRLEARLAPEALAVIRRAAEIEDRSLSDFVVAAAHEAARRTIEDAQIARLAVDDQRALAAAILAPAAPTAALRRAEKAYRRLVAAA